MPLVSALDDNRLFEAMLRARAKPLFAYGIAVLAVLVATFARWALSEYVIDGLPYITFFPAIILATFFGGFGPGLLAIVLSGLIAEFAFVPFAGTATEPRAWISFGLFIVLSVVNAALVGMLNRGLEGVFAQRNSIRTLIESSPSGIVLVDESGEIKLINAATERLFGYGRQELLGQKLELLFPSQGIPVRSTLPPSVQAVNAGAMPAEHARRKDGSEFAAEITFNTLRRNGHSGFLATVVDITERRRWQERQQLLIRELHHRTRNLFTVIQAIVARSLVEGQTMGEAKRVLSSRLLALTRAHMLLAEAAWEGVSLAEIVNREVATFSEQLTVTGCNVSVDASAAQHFALIIHELATNAVKYGALSCPQGRIAIRGHVTDQDGQSSFVFVWREIGGPPVQPPARKGFGSTILVDAVRDLGHEVALDYTPDGLNYELRLILGTERRIVELSGSACAS